MIKVFRGNIYKCTEFKEHTVNLSESAHSRVSYDQEIIKENAVLIKHGYRYLDIDACDVSIAGETMGPRYQNQVYVLEDELVPYHAAPIFKVIEVDDEIFVIPVSGEVVILPNTNIIQSALARIMNNYDITVKDMLIEKVELLLTKLEKNPVVKNSLSKSATRKRVPKQNGS